MGQKVSPSEKNLSGEVVGGSVGADTWASFLPVVPLGF